MHRSTAIQGIIHHCSISSFIELVAIQGNIMTSESTTPESTTSPANSSIKSNVHNNTDPLHGLTLAVLLERLVDLYGWDELARFINIRCFIHDPSIKSSLSFLRRTPWARKQVEDFYIKFGHADWQESQSH